jgi:hypothetical protein
VELAVAMSLLPVPQPVLAVPAAETDVVAEIAAPIVVPEIVVPEAVVPPPPPPPPPDVLDQAERTGWLRRVRSLIALIFLAALLGATLAAAVIGIGVLIALAAQHAIG